MYDYIQNEIRITVYIPVLKKGIFSNNVLYFLNVDMALEVHTYLTKSWFSHWSKRAAYVYVVCDGNPIQ